MPLSLSLSIDVVLPGTFLCIENWHVCKQYSVLKCSLFSIGVQTKIDLSTRNGRVKGIYLDWLGLMPSFLQLHLDALADCFLLERAGGMTTSRSRTDQR